MARGAGYILEWQHNDVAGLIHVCSGDHLVGDDVAFALASCQEELQDRLRQIDIFAPRVCPSPSGALCVEFTFDLFEGGDIATNVGQLNCEEDNS